MVNFEFKDTEALRRTTINALGLEEKYLLPLKKNDIITIGNLIDRWDKIREIRNMGASKGSVLCLLM